MSRGIINFTRVTNIFEGSIERWRSPHSGAPIGAYLGGNETRFVVEANGARVDGSYVPRPGDRIVFADVPADGGTIALIVISVILAAGSYLVQRATMPKIGKDRGLDDFGPRNTFGGIQTIAANGVPIPLVYGQVRVGGNIIDSFESEAFDDDLSLLDHLNKGLENLGLTGIQPKPNHLSRTKSVLNTRVAYCLGPVADITGLEIDSQPIAQFPGLHSTTRFGVPEQPGIAGFNQNVNTRTIALPVLNASPVSITTQTEIDTAEIVLRFPKGIFKLKEDGFKYLHEISVTIDYRIKNSSVWTTAGTFTVNDFATTALFYRVKLPELDRNIYDIRVTRNTADETDENRISDLQFYFVNEIAYDERHHPGVALAAFRQLPGDQVSPVNPTNYTALVKGFKNIRIYTDETTYTTGWSDNPAWCCGHFITEKLTGLGKFFDWTNIDIPSFIAWAAHAEELVLDGNGHLERRATFNRAFSTPTNAFEVLQTFASGSGVMLIYKGSKFRAVIDKPAPIRQIFNEANIKEGSLGYAWFPKKELPTRIHGRFINEEDNYNLDSIMQEDPDVPIGEYQHEKRLSLLHVTRPSQVSRELMRIVNANKYVTSGVELKTGLQGAQIDLGDVFGISTKTAALGIASGLIVYVALNDRTLQIDDDVTLESGKSYEIHVQHQDDGVIDTKLLVTGATETTNIVTVADKFWRRAIKAGDRYSIGETGSTIELFRVDDIEVGDYGPGFEVKLRGGRYDERLYNIAPVSNPDVTVIEAPDSRDRVPPKPSSLNLSFRNMPNLPRFGRQTRRAIDVDWVVPESFAVDHYEVWWRETNKTWIRAGETKARRFELERGIDADTQYEVAVRAVSANGLTLAIDNSAKGTITTTPEGTGSSGSADYSDVISEYECNGTGALLDSLAGVPDLTSFTEIGTCGEKTTGKFRNCRGPLTSSNYFSNTWSGKVHDPTAGSFSGIFWFRPLSIGSDSFLVQIWDSANVNRQAYIIRAGAGGDDYLTFDLYDGVNPGSAVLMRITTAAKVIQDQWQMCGYAWDASTKQARGFYGRQAGEYYYKTATHSAGFGITADVQQYRVGNVGSYDVDHFSFFTRAFSLINFLDHWNNHAGLDFDEF